jgi:hypothetical protein
MPESNLPKLLWQPSPELLQNSNLSRYIAWLAREKNLHFHDYHALWQWSAREIPAFWESLWEYFHVGNGTPYEQALAGEKMPLFRWFRGRP